MTSLAPFKGDNSVYIIQLVERQESDTEAFKTDPAEKARHRQALVQTKKMEAFSNWFAARKKASELTIHQGLSLDDCSLCCKVRRGTGDQQPMLHGCTGNQQFPMLRRRTSL